MPGSGPRALNHRRRYRKFTTFGLLSLLVVLSCLFTNLKSEPISLPPSFFSYLPLFFSLVSHLTLTVGVDMIHWNTSLFSSSTQADKQTPGWGAFFSFWHSVLWLLSASAMVQILTNIFTSLSYCSCCLFITCKISDLDSDSSFMINPIPCFSRRLSWKHRIHWRWFNVVSQSWENMHALLTACCKVKCI